MDSIIKNERKDKFNITCKITNYKSCQDSFIPFFKYIEYKINLKINKKNWEIKKRFKDFDELHQKLLKSNIKNLPKLPNKRIFNSEEVIKERQIKLQKYLTNLLRRDDVYQLDLIFDFVELKKEDYLLMKNNIEDSDSSDNSPYSTFSRRQSIYGFKSAIEQEYKEDIVINHNFYYSYLNLDEEKQENVKNSAKILINEFLNDLNSRKNYNKSFIIEKFKQEFFFNNYSKKKKNFNFRNEDIYKLFFGDKTTKKFGLIYHCGEIKGNLLGAERCIEFLNNIIEYEYNLESEYFINILRLGKLENFKQMNFNTHLSSNKPHLFSTCCRIIRIILNDERHITLETLLEDENLIEKVQNYILLSETF